MRSAATRALFERLEGLCEGALVVDRDARIVWINEKYVRRFGLEGAAQAIGRPVEEVIPASRMREVVDGDRPIVLDIMQIGESHCVVTRMPLHDEQGALIGAAGFVLYDRIEGLQPIFAKAAQLQARLNAAERELASSRRAKYSLASFIGQSAAATEIKRQARRAALLDSTVLLSGETGTGKELLAHAIHNLSPRANRPFVSVNAAAIPDTLVEAELFGSAAGAYTGADRRGRDGKFKVADGGTLFLDEIGDMPLPLQSKLLRVLQEHEIEPLGSNRVLAVDVRVIAATSSDLAARVADGRFRADLYYRLNVLELKLPALRDRIEDLPMVAERALDEIGSRVGQPVELDAGALALLARHHWPGNVRELHNVLERTVMLNESPLLKAEHLARVLPESRAAPTPARAGALADAVAQAERRAIQLALEASRGNKAAAAQALGISRAALYEKLAALGLTTSTERGAGRSQRDTP
jgi:transcriptional regulator with PAS, ATPase and Fis domain